MKCSYINVYKHYASIIFDLLFSWPTMLVNKFLLLKCKNILSVISCVSDHQHPIKCGCCIDRPKLEALMRLCRKNIMNYFKYIFDKTLSILYYYCTVINFLYVCKLIWVYSNTMVFYPFLETKHNNS